MRRLIAATIVCALTPVLFQTNAFAAKRRIASPVDAMSYDRHAPETGASSLAQSNVTAQRRGNAQRRVANHKRSKTAVAARHRPLPTQAVTAAYSSGFGGGYGLVSEARRYLGGNPTGRSSLWCADFMNLVLERSGHRGTGSRLAADFARYGRRVNGPQIGAIAVMSRGRRGGHVGVVSGIDANGKVIVISGNHNRRVAEAAYPARRIYAYVLP